MKDVIVGLQLVVHGLHCNTLSLLAWATCCGVVDASSLGPIAWWCHLALRVICPLVIVAAFSEVDRELLAGTKADILSAVFPVNIMSISSKYEGKPFLNFLKSEWPCNMNVVLLKCCMKDIADNNFVGMNALTFVCFSHSNDNTVFQTT
jgi:hypothetical protein